MVRGMSAHECGHLAICVNNIIIMCIGLVHDIFTRNIYYGIDMKIDRIE